MKTFSITLLAILLLFTNYNSMKFFKNIRDKLSKAFKIIKPDEMQNEAQHGLNVDSTRVVNYNNELIIKMKEDKNNLRNIYNFLYNSLVLSITQDCIADMLTSECELLMQHMESVLSKSLKNDIDIEMYQRNKNIEQSNLSNQEIKEEMVVNAGLDKIEKVQASELEEYNFYEPFDILGNFFTAPEYSNEIVNSEEEEKREALENAIHNFEQLFEEKLSDRYDKLMTLMTIQLVNMRKAMYGTNEDIELLLKELNEDYIS